MTLKFCSRQRRDDDGNQGNDDRGNDRRKKVSLTHVEVDPGRNLVQGKKKKKTSVPTSFPQHPPSANKVINEPRSPGLSSHYTYFPRLAIPVYTNMTHYSQYNIPPYPYPLNWNNIINSVPISAPGYVAIPRNTIPVFSPQMYSPQVYPYRNVATQNVPAESSVRPQAPYDMQPIYSPRSSNSEPHGSVPRTTDVHNSSAEDVAGPHNVMTEHPEMHYYEIPDQEIAYNSNISTGMVEVDQTETQGARDPHPNELATSNDQNLQSHIEAEQVTPQGAASNEQQEMLDYFLHLPRELFPSPRLMSFDPNPIIDIFCREENIESHWPWILDLEFGIPRAPVTRHVASYDVSQNSVICRCDPEVVLPDFETCSSDFKFIFMFYYSYIMSSWYRGYINLYRDNASLENFDAWLTPPMQAIGLCWA